MKEEPMVSPYDRPVELQQHVHLFIIYEEYWYIPLVFYDISKSLLEWSTVRAKAARKKKLWKSW